MPNPSEHEPGEKTPPLAVPSVELHRERLSDTRNSLTHKFTVDTTEGYLIVGLYENGKPGELFIQIAKEGSTLGGLMDTVGILTSMLLQHGVKLSAIADKLKDTRFQPSGFTKSDVVKEASSLTDYIFRWLEHVFSEESLEDGGQNTQFSLSNVALRQRLSREKLLACGGNLNPSEKHFRSFK